MSIRPNEADVSFWRAIRKQARKPLKLYIADLDEPTLSKMTFDILYGLEGRGLAIVPILPTTRMVAASMAVARKGPIRKVWLSEKAKHRVRLIAAYQAAPDWKSAFHAELQDAQSPTEGSP